ncbi:hypothetical protein RN69_15750 [Bradyrhizobium japonicum]|nr:hypothetical protein RN69_15750 [Bradyrhizobium japonicum]
MRARLGLASFTDRVVSLDTWWKRFSRLAQAFCLCGKAVFKGCCLLETASLHGATPFLRRRERKLVFSSPMYATSPAATSQCALPNIGKRVLIGGGKLRWWDAARGGPSIGPGGVMMLGLPDRLLSRGTETVTA